jgi:hypothetical protein
MEKIINIKSILKIKKTPNIYHDPTISFIFINLYQNIAIFSERKLEDKVFVFDRLIETLKTILKYFKS